LDVTTDFLLGRVDTPDMVREADPLYRYGSRLTARDRLIAEEFLRMLAERDQGVRSRRKMSKNINFRRNVLMYKAQQLLETAGLLSLPVDLRTLAENYDIVLEAMKGSGIGVNRVLSRSSTTTMKACTKRPESASAAYRTKLLRPTETQSWRSVIAEHSPGARSGLFERLRSRGGGCRV